MSMWRFLLFDIAKRVAPAMAEEFGRARLKKALATDAAPHPVDDTEVRIARLESEVEQARIAFSEMSEALAKFEANVQAALRTLYIWNAILTAVALLSAVGMAYLLLMR